MVPIENTAVGRFSPKRKESIEQVNQLAQTAEDLYLFAEATDIKAVANMLAVVHEGLIDRYVSLAKAMSSVTN